MFESDAPRKEKKPIESLPKFCEAVTKVEGELNGRGRVLIRYSGTEPKARIMVEGDDEKRVSELANDLADQLRRALGGVSFVYHFAALTGVGQSMYDIANYVDVNCTGTANLLEIIAKDKLPVRRIVVSSSRAVYGEGTHHCPNCGVVYPPIRNRNDMEQDRFEVFCPI